MRLVIVGRGRVGNGLRRSLADHSDVEVDAVGRNLKPSVIARADVVVLAVADDAIESVANDIAHHLSPQSTVLHCAGARSVEELRACKKRGAATGVMHPLVSFPSKRSNPSLAGTTFAVNGDRRAVAASRRIAAACGARAVVAKTGDPAYHAAAALAANGAAALAYASVSILERLGFGKREAERSIGGLLQTVGENVQRLGVPDALTGPIARGDATTVAEHRRALRRTSKGALAAYDAVVPVIVRCARAAGLPRARATEILRETEG